MAIVQLWLVRLVNELRLLQRIERSVEFEVKERWKSSMMFAIEREVWDLFCLQKLLGEVVGWDFQ